MPRRGVRYSKPVGTWLTPLDAAAFHAVAEAEGYASTSAMLREMIELELALHRQQPHGKRPPLEARAA